MDARLPHRAGWPGRSPAGWLCVPAPAECARESQGPGGFLGPCRQGAGRGLMGPSSGFRSNCPSAPGSSAGGAGTPRGRGFMLMEHPHLSAGMQGLCRPSSGLRCVFTDPGSCGNWGSQKVGTELSCPVSGRVPLTPKRARPETGHGTSPCDSKGTQDGVEILGPRSTGNKHPLFLFLPRVPTGRQKELRQRGDR